MPPAAAIVMRAKDEMPHVQAALEALQRQTIRDFALYATDSGSTDGTVEALRSAGADLVQIPPGSYAPGAVLNAAIARTTSETIVLLNADAIPLSVRWLEALLQPIREGRTDATYSRQVPRPDARFIVAYDYERAFGPRNADPAFFSAVACAFTRPLWTAHPFRPDGYAEDAAWARECLAAGARIVFAPDSAVEHSHNYPLRQLYEKKRRQGRTFAETGETPRPGRQAFAFLKEAARDTAHACRALRLQTIPYNLAYRATIHAGLHAGLKEGAR